MGSWFDVIYEPAIPFGEPYLPFTRVSIETTGWCNRACSFCPSRHRRKGTLMSDSLYDSIVQQLEGFDGVVQWFYCNEPLTDKRRLSRLRALRDAAPKCTIHLTTNGELLRKVGDIYDLFYAGVNSFNINVYDDSHWFRLRTLYLDILQSWKQIKTGPHCWKKIRGQYISLTSMIRPELHKLHNWSNTVQVSNLQTGSGRCARPHRHIVVCWNGKVPVCCAVDPETTEPLGDANIDKLVDIWNNRRFFEVRFQLQNANRAGPCEGCVERMAYPHVVRDVSL